MIDAVIGGVKAAASLTGGGAAGAFLSALGAEANLDAFMQEGMMKVGMFIMQTITNPVLNDLLGGLGAE